ncbi:Gti1/Pac2 family-domain-containing protein [Coprinopsis sp. MPI-PUGE-AT-0042]|nr:Gti1/Pac2 family-domain-containing protein [Coprinopsis sp. MPI-PUGE-AT-0042]
MQRPTLQSVRIRSTRDALQVFYAVACNRLPLITRRLDAEERRAIVPGNVYVWEERGANTEPTGLGMERWTDGMGWGPSRVRDEFLFYHQKEAEAIDEYISPVTPWAHMMRAYSDPRHIPEAERLIKQTYSVHVSLPADHQKGIIRKWHLTAYFSQARLDQLTTVDNIQGVGDIPVPEGLFRSARTAKARRNTQTQPSESGGSPKQGSPHGSSQSPTGSPTQSRFASSSSYTQGTTSSAGHSKVSSMSSTSGTFSTRSPNLVPLEVLQSTQPMRRDPTDVQTLRRFGS